MKFTKPSTSTLKCLVSHTNCKKNQIYAALSGAVQFDVEAALRRHLAR